jgi:hypothetical protein
MAISCQSHPRQLSLYVLGAMSSGRSQCKPLTLMVTKDQPDPLTRDKVRDRWNAHD